MDRLRALEAFVAVADAGSFTRAARALQISAPSLTRIVAEQEAALGVKLLHRSTRAVSLTDVGRAFLLDARNLLDAYAAAAEAATGALEAPRGVLRVTAPALFGRHCVAPIILDYLTRHPDVSVEAVFVDRVVRLIDEGFDVALRIGALPDSSLTALRVGQVRRVICGAPSYFAEHGRPATPADLRDHRIIEAEPIGDAGRWRFAKNVSIPVRSRLRASTMDAAIDFAKAGWGLTQAMSYQVGPDLRAGALETTLDAHALPPAPIHILHPEGRAAAAKIRSFVAMAVDRLRGNAMLS